MKKTIAIIDYQSGNIASAYNAVCQVVKKRNWPTKVLLTNQLQKLNQSDVLVFPGQGAAKQAMSSLKKLGLDQLIKDKIESGVPFLGICIGMQILFDYSNEQETHCLGILAGKVVKFSQDKQNKIKIPHMGWNIVTPHPDRKELDYLWKKIQTPAFFYHVHSYYPRPLDQKVIGATTDYGETFTSLIARRNLVATQFHPEKSGQDGLQFIENFLHKYLV